MTSLGRRLLATAAACAVLAAALPADARACTTFVLKSPAGTFFGRNYDFGIGYGMVVTNKRAVAKEAVLDAPGEKPARWVSRYGSLTFNQFGREFPQGGMNEKGLVVELMWLDGTKYPAPDARPAVNELAWIQFMLDTCATTREVLDSAEKSVRIAGGVPIHFLVADRSGASSSIEFIDGKLVARAGESLGAPVLTNDTYDASSAYLKAHAGFGGKEPLRPGPSSLDRFCRAAALVKAYAPASSGDPVSYAFRILDDVSQGAYTRWSIVYDTANLTVHFRTLEHREPRVVAMRDFDFACSSPVRVYDLASEGAGDVGAKFVPYSRAANRSLVGRSFAGVDFLKDTPAAALDALAAYPDALGCAR